MTAAPPQRPLPWPDAETAPFWEATRRRKLVVQRCSACGTHRFYPRALCPSCHAEAHDWVETGGRGSVFSHTVVHRAPSPAFAGQVPYVLAIVALDEGPHMLAEIVDTPAATVAIGMRLAVDFREIGEDMVLPVFRPAP
jgi:uncharacterized OB-fold protein